MHLYSRFALLTAMAAATLFAKPNFSGDWKMNAAKSNFGPMAANAPKKIERSIQHTDPALKFRTVQVGSQGEVATELNYSTDGKEVTNKLRGQDVKGNAKWDGESLVIETKRIIQETEIVQSDKWTLSEDGKSMMVVSTLQTPQGNIEFTVAFEKQ